MNISAIGTNSILTGVKHNVNFGNANKLADSKSTEKTNTQTQHYYFNPEEEKKLEDAYKQKLLDLVFEPSTNENGEPVYDAKGRPILALKPEIKQGLDEAEFEFVDDKRQKFRSSIKDMILRHLTFKDAEEDTSDEIKGVFHGCTADYVPDILEHGFDMTKISRTAFGPGIYFAFSEGDAGDYSGYKLTADVKKTKHTDGKKGNFAIINDNFYERNINGQVYSLAAELAGVDISNLYDSSQPYYVARTKESIIRSLMNQYCRQILVKDLGVDAAVAHSRGYHPCVVVFNPDAIENIEDYSAKHGQHFNPYSYYNY